jgi:hypothetical protein
LRCAPRPWTALPVARALRAAAALLGEAGLPWGPTGSVGFELASGVRTVTPSSDLDLLVRPTRLQARATLERLHVALQRLPAGVDCQIETDDGAIALGELLSGASELLVRTPTGPRLISAPWPDAAYDWHSFTPARAPSDPTCCAPARLSRRDQHTRRGRDRPRPHPLAGRPGRDLDTAEALQSTATSNSRC